MPVGRLLPHVPFMDVYLFSLFSLVLAKGQMGVHCGIVGIVGIVLKGGVWELF